ncbi:hypothetical protein F2P56_009660 [Juglans regia]|uniref:Protein FAR1-RELATED SEQUENCE n=2 Tax=Juglans regia TaxID=51240 RepID=A0A833XZL3_JUGRE|nr:protein FAR-RED ELONGATED HYPOCOTYL 3-like isoform X2 [Juglans regia]KAF5473010.1 hypothetical protein F2P56_009660 [Juglans regia]
MRMIYCYCHFEKMDGVITTYSVDDEVKAEDFINEVTYTVYFTEAECAATCVCGLFDMRRIICRHNLIVFSARKVRELPEKYILDRWRKDIKHKYTIIPSSYNIADQRPETVRYKRILKIFYEVIANAISCNGHTEDMVSKLYAMNEVYRTSKPYSINSNVGVSTVNAAMEESSKNVLSHHVVKGNGRSPCKRRMSTMEEHLKKVKTKAAKKKNDKGKSILRRSLDTELLESNGNQLGPSEMRTQENVQTLIMVDQESAQQEVMGTQKSMQLGIDGTSAEDSRWNATK